jgi:CubicO group peptidase (beta-lactamase class C family)
MGRGGWGRNYGQVFGDIGGSWHGWAGWGGSRLTFNRERQIGIGYAQTRMGSGLGGLRDERTDALFMAIAQAHDEVMGNK